MKIAFRIVSIAGGVIALIAGCCMDSPGVYSYIAGCISVVGGLMAASGYAMYTWADQREVKKCK